MPARCRGLLALLKYLGSNEKIMRTKIFGQEQIARAVELGLGAGSPERIAVIPADAHSRAMRDEVAGILMQG